jgi:LuxR family maltose regulon positive regulatory protein
VADGQLRRGAKDPAPIALGSEAWHAWLADHDAFRFAGEAGSFTARKERRPGTGGYWKAFRRREGRLHTAYLGQSEALTADRLMLTARTLAAAGDPSAEALVAVPRTRFFVPPLSAARIERPRLLARLRAPDRPIVLLLAPTGYGKTTLLADWLATDGLRAAWVSLEAVDDDPVRFWMVVIAGIEAAVPGAGRAALVQLRQSQPPIVSGILPRLIEDLARCLPAPASHMVLVLDDLHLSPSPAVAEALTTLAEYLPPGVRLVMTSQREPALPLARWRAKGWLTELRVADLAFSPAESVAFLRHALGEAPDDAVLARLATQTEGWAAALRLAALALADGGTAAEAGEFGGEHRHVFDYLLEEVLAQQPADMQTFLLTTSVLDRFSGALADAVLATAARHGLAVPTGGGQAMLQRVEAANLFLMPLDATRRWYRYHALFAEAMRQRLREQHPGLEPELHRVASDWFEAEGRLGEAIEQALAAEAWAKAGRLVEQASDTLWGRGESVVLTRWLAALPAALCRRRPRLALAQANLLMWTHGLGEVGSWLAAMSAGLDEEEAEVAAGRTTGLLPPAAVVRARGAVLHAYLRRQDDPAAAYAGAVQAMAALPADDLNWRATASLLMGEMARHMGQLDEAEQRFNESAMAAQRAGNAIVALTALALCSRCLVDRGRLHQALRQWQHARQLARSWQAEELPASAFHDVVMAYIHYERNELAQADALASAAAAVLAEGGSPLWHAYAQFMLARIRAASGDPDQALRLLDSAQDVFAGFVRGDRAQSVRQSQVGHRIRMLEALGDSAAAQRWARSPEVAVPVRWGPDGNISAAAAHLGVARARWVAGDLAEALQLLLALRPRLEAAGAGDLLLRALTLCALVQDQLGQAEAAAETLARVLALAQPEGHLRVFVDEGPALAELLQRLPMRGSARRQARAVLSAFHQAASPGLPSAPPDGQAVTPAVSAREREILQLIATGSSNRDIAGTLGLAETTVKWHCAALYAKLGVRSRTQAVAHARALGILE